MLGRRFWDEIPSEAPESYNGTISKLRNFIDLEKNVGLNLTLYMGLSLT
jgi:hypothetical protein